MDGQLLQLENPRKLVRMKFFAQPVSQNDSNWAGYVVASDLQNPQRNVTSVNASWIVPQVNVTNVNVSFSAVWVGIGGFFDRSLIQVGSEQDSINGEAVYSLWYELLPRDAVTIDAINVSPGDNITASISLIDASLNLWSIYIADGSQIFQGNVSYVSSQLSAEWIVERPAVNRRITTLANITTVNFTDCTATIGNKTGAINGFPNVQSIMYQAVMGTSGIEQLTYISNLSNDGASFNISTYNPALIPEFPFWLVIPLFSGILLATAILRKYYRRNGRNN